MKNSGKMFKTYSRLLNYKILLVLIFVLAVTFRCWFLASGNIDFSYDQARDAFAVQEILGGHLKVLGPPTSGTPGLFHGALFYYVIAPAYLFGHGNPITVSYWLVFLNSLAIFPVFYLAYLLTKKTFPALLASLIFAFSYDAMQFSGFVSNVSLGIIFVPAIFIGLYLWIKRKSKWAPLITGLAFGLSVQSEIAFCFYLIPILIWLLIYKNKITKKQLVVFIVSFVFAVSTMIISEIKFGFPGIKGLYYLFSGQDRSIQTSQFSDFLSIFINQVGVRFANTLYPFNVVFGSLLGYVIVIYAFVRKNAAKVKNPVSWQNFLISYIPAHILALPFGGSITPHIMIGAIPAISVFIAIFLWEKLENKKAILVAVIVILLIINLGKFIKVKTGPTPDYFTDDYLLSTEIKMIDYTYKLADGKPFSISSLTSPLYINTLWSYLYNWYGKTKYGYIPYWIGRDQIGQPGGNLEFAPSNVSRHFYIIEPTYRIPKLWVTYAGGDQEAMSKLIESKSFGRMTVEERLMKDEN